jgi:hypothetical protein
MVPENNDNCDKRFGSTEEMLGIYFKEALDHCIQVLEIQITPADIARFCDENEIESPKLFTFQLFEIIKETILTKSMHPDVRYFLAPQWLDVKGKKISLSADSTEELGGKLPKLPEKEVDSSEYRLLANKFFTLMQE